MIKPKLSLLFPLLALMAALLLLNPSVIAQQQPASGSSAAQQQQDPASTPNAMSSPAADSQVFTGKITKAGSRLVLKDSATKATYALDDQDKAKQFEGQPVKVTGKLDGQSNTIRITAIEPGS